MDSGIGGIGGYQFDIAVSQVGTVDELKGELTIEESQHHVTVMYVCRLVHHDDVTFGDTGIAHTISLDATIERGFGMTDKVAVEIERLVLIVGCG